MKKLYKFLDAGLKSHSGDCAMKNFIRHGDLNFHAITKKEFENLTKGVKKEQSKKSFVLQEGETTGHKHVLTVDDITAMEAFKLPDGRILLKIKDGRLTHEDHKPLEFPKTGYWIMERERELDHFSESLERRVID